MPDDDHWLDLSAVMSSEDLEEWRRWVEWKPQPRRPRMVDMGRPAGRRFRDQSVAGWYVAARWAETVSPDPRYL